MNTWMCSNCKSLTGPMAPNRCSACGMTGTFELQPTKEES